MAARVGHGAGDVHEELAGLGERDVRRDVGEAPLEGGADLREEVRERAVRGGKAPGLGDGEAALGGDRTEPPMVMVNTSPGPTMYSSGSTAPSSAAASTVARPIRAPGVATWSGVPEGSVGVWAVASPRPTRRSASAARRRRSMGAGVGAGRT